MKIFNYEVDHKIIPAILIDDFIYDLSSLYSSTLDIIKDAEQYQKKINNALQLKKLLQGPSLSQVKFKPPIMYPNKLMCMAGNYIEHIHEMGGNSVKQPELTQAPWLFLVPPTTVMIGHQEPVLLPPKYNNIDYEGELAVVIGKKGKYIPAEKANDYIFGYTIYNDVSERKPYITEHVEKPRDLSFWYKKSFDTFGPCGPYITTKDEIQDPQNLQIDVLINGIKRQSCHTSEMVFSIPKIIEFISKLTTLEPGDIISTGTPPGVGVRTGQFLKETDIMEITIEKLGTLKNQLCKETYDA